MVSYLYQYYGDKYYTMNIKKFDFTVSTKQLLLLHSLKSVQTVVSLHQFFYTYGHLDLTDFVMVWWSLGPIDFQPLPVTIKSTCVHFTYHTMWMNWNGLAVSGRLYVLATLEIFHYKFIDHLIFFYIS